MLCRLDVYVLKSVGGEPEFLHYWRSAKCQVIAVTDVHRGSGKCLTGRSSTDVRACFNKKCIHAGSGEIRSRYKAIVPRPDDDRVVVGCRRRAGARTHPLSLAQFACQGVM